MVIREWELAWRREEEEVAGLHPGHSSFTSALPVTHAHRGPCAGRCREEAKAYGGKKATELI